MAQPPGGSPLPRGEGWPPGGALGAPWKTRVLAAWVWWCQLQKHVPAGGDGGMENNTGGLQPLQGKGFRTKGPDIWGFQSLALAGPPLAGVYYLFSFFMQLKASAFSYLVAWIFFLKIISSVYH